MGGKYFVYEHWRPDKDVCFYVGKGHGRRADVMYARGPYHVNIQKKLARQGLCVEIRLVRGDLEEWQAFVLEIERIAFWRSIGVKLANRTAGGEGGSDPSEETRALMRAAKLGRKLSDEHKAKISAKSRETGAKPEYKAKLSASLRVALNRPETKEKRSKSQKARIRTKEHYAKVSASLMGRKLSPEHIEATRKGLTGRKQTPESIAKRVASNKGRKRSPEFCTHMKAVWTPERRAAQSERTKAMMRERGRISTSNQLGEDAE